MNKLIDLKEFPVKDVLPLLLQDKTTGNNIIFATDAYKTISITERTEITVSLLEKISSLIQPRVLKSQEEQDKRTKNKAEVFTPAWICNRMNNHCDEEWFHKKNVFNIEQNKSWLANETPISFNHKNDWKKYVLSKRLEITCGEAPYLVSRYDAATGVSIPVKNRIGILDRKLRVVSENTSTEKNWKKWAYKAYKSVYGYEYQGDNLLIARINLLITFVDYMFDKFKRIPTIRELKFLCNIIVWNIWQMDGITGTVPFYTSVEDLPLIKFFEYDNDKNIDQSNHIGCRIFDWDNKNIICFKDIKGVNCEV